MSKQSEPHVQEVHDQGTTVEEAGNLETELQIGVPKANSTEVETTTDLYLDSQANTLIEEKFRNGQDELDIETTVSENVATGNPDTDILPTKRQPKLTEKGKSYRLTELIRQRKRSKREIQMQIGNIQALMGIDRNLETVSKETIRLNGIFNHFGELHEEVQELHTEEDRNLDSPIYENLNQEILNFQTFVQNWMTEADQRIRDERLERGSIRSSIKSRRSRRSNTSSTTSRARFLEAKAKQAELIAKLSVLDKIEAAEKHEIAAAEAVRKANKEAERVKLMADCKIAAAISKVYEDANREDDDQHLGSDDPDKSISEEYTELPGLRDIPKFKGIVNETVIEKQRESLPEPRKSFEEGELNPYTQEIKIPTSTLQFTTNQPKDKVDGTVEKGTVEKSSETLSRPKNGIQDGHLQSPRKTQSYFDSSSLHEPHSALWEKMELRMSQPPPRPTPFDGDPARYLRFRTNFRDQVESKLTLTDSEKMNYLMAYTTGRAREAIENYEGLPNGCQLALRVLKQRFGQTAMIVQALKSAVIAGPKIRTNDNAVLLAFADKIENCYWSMIELNSGELDCTTNLKQIYDRLPDPLQRKWRKEAKSYRQRSGGKEPALKELCSFISAESVIENDPVYGNNDTTPDKEKLYNRNKKLFPATFGTVPRARIPTLATSIETGSKHDIARDTRNDRNSKTSRSCKVCKKGIHEVAKCLAFSSKNLNWRRRFARYNRLCYRCLSELHKQSDCPSKEGCKEKDCLYPMTHHSLLHMAPRNDMSDDKKNEEAVDNVNNHATTEIPRRNFVMLKVVPLRVVAENGGTVTTYGLLDTAAVSTMITSQLAQELQLQGISERVNINTVVQSNHECILPRVRFEITSTTQDNPRFQVHRALVVDDLHIPEQYCPNHLDLSGWPHLEDLELPNMHVDLKKISVLVGQDVPQAHIVLNYCWGDDPPNQPYGMKTPFAWCVAGPTGKKDTKNKPIALSIIDDCNRNSERTDLMLHQQVEKFWSLENHGFGNSEESSNSIEDARALHILESTTRHNEGGYEVGLLWKNENVQLPNNRRQAERRFEQLKKRFKRNPEFAEKYKMVMNDYIKKGYAKKLSEDEAKRTSDITWYLPHHGVVNPNKPKVRVVYDAAAEYGGVSLNKELLQGPQLNNNLIGVLLRFRKEKVAVASDIESMFHRVACAEKDTDALRFLWWSESIDEPPSDHKMTVHLFGKADSPCIAAWALKTTADDHEHEFSKEVSQVVKRNFYVDDCLVSVPTPDQAIKLALDLTKLLRKGNFRLTKFVSNNKEVLTAIPAEERTIKDLDLDKLPVERALGVQWDIKTDTFGVKTSLKQGKLDDNTRRGCLSILSSTFDPLGMVGPVLLPAKRIMQKTWQLKLGWDDDLPEDLQNGWKGWKEDLALLSQVNIPRCYSVNGCSNILSLQLHHFCDASEIGYGTVSYLRKESTDGLVECAFIMAKSRTAPLQYVSMPRLELQAATVAVRVHRLIKKEIDLNISSTHFWTDSKITLQYINNESRRFKTYVANRVAEIRELSQPNMWRHCPGELNPADDASRGLSARQLLTNERWLQGPAFLLNSEENWPSQEPGELPDDEAEVKNEKPIFVVTEPDKLQELLMRYSSWAILQRKVAWLLKFKKYLRRRRADQGNINDSDKHLTSKDLQLATEAIVKIVQRQVYADEIRDLEKHKVVRLSSKIVKLRPVLIGNILRVGGRIVEAPISFESKFPMIVPSNHHVTQLIIVSFHQKLAHAGQDHILSQMREQFWIPKGRSAVRKAVRSCLLCKKYKATRMEQIMADLPAFRTTAYEPCFTHTGVDYFGPLSIKRGRAVVKRWGAIFTCLNSRALHLELANTLETDCFINLLRRFVNRRGAPKVIYSDNGTNFVGAEREIREAIERWNQDQINNELLQKGTQWVFQPPKASHASGVWERLIRSTRKALKAILGESLVDEEVAVTVLTEVESILNSRPLCAASDDPRDCEPLTPNHLLLQRSVQALPPGTFEKEDIYSRKKWRQTQILANHFWKRWLKEYIPALQERQKWHRVRRNATVGDIVLLVDEGLPRGKWLLGRIVKAIPGRDGLVRTVEVKTQNSILVRPIQKLCMLEEATSVG